MDNIRNLNERGLIDLKILLLACAKNYLGIVNLPDENDLALICNFLKSNFGEFNLKEIDLALQMYSAGSLNVNSKPYGVLSTMFLSDILNEYRMHRKALNAFTERRKNEQLLLKENEISSEEKNERLTEFILNWVTTEKKIPDTYAWDEVFLHLEKIKEINLTMEDKKDFIELIKIELNEKIEFYKNVFNKKAEVMEMLNTLANDKMLKSLCRKKLVHLYLNRLIEKENGNSN